MAKSRNGLVAAGLTGLGFLFLLLAFTSHSWVVANGRVTNPQFQSIGLWSICLTGFEEFHHWYDTKFYGCWWVFEEEYYMIHDFLFPGFFISTEIFMLMSFLAGLISVFLVTMYMCCSRTQDKFILLLRVISINSGLSAGTGCIALIIFGMYGDSRDWLPHWENNDIGWAYYSAVCGVLLMVASSILYFVESRVHTIKKRKTEDAQNAYHMEQRRDFTHTEI
uniref:Uncharacterized protein n=1 Tax=Cacopsylla melanoneura TaxID=428564 RepID=A0A8D8XKQ0_9HEMI